jgi:ubiquinone/menaquinone biosynthesis C-methylase UbiE
MSLGGVIFAAMYDSFMAKAEKAGLTDLRTRLIAAARGQVLEIGAGTGVNLPLYGAEVESLAFTEPEAPMVKRLQRRVREQTRPVTVLRAPAEDLPFEDNSFDTVVSTLVLCTVNDQPRALREIRRVLRPDGQLLFLEHVLSQQPTVVRLQNRINRINRVVAHGCNCNRPTLTTLEAAGLTITQLEHGELPKAPPFVRPLVLGIATPASVRQPTPTR